jgi:hypothetical protein
MKTQYSDRERDASDPKAGYFLPAFFGCVCGFFFGVNGLGGVFSIRRSTSSSDGLVFSTGRV